MTETEALRPDPDVCPFCRSSNWRASIVSNTNGNLKRVACADCGAVGPARNGDIGNAIAAWNTRALSRRPSPAGDDVERVARAIYEASEDDPPSFEWSECPDEWKDEHRALARAALAAAPGRVDWRSMDSAPKDGTPILFWTDGGVVVGHWAEEEPPAPDNLGMDAGWIADYGETCPACPAAEQPAQNQPVAWAPLPEPPASPSSPAEGDGR